MSFRPRIVVFSDDWGRHPSSCQHLIRELLPRYRVDWINTIGTRRPSFSRQDFARAKEKLSAWIARPKQAEDSETQQLALPENLTVHSPIHWPGFKNRLERNLNLVLFMRALKKLILENDPPTAIVTTASIPADLAEARPDLNWVYYCVDDLSEWPGLDGPALLELEETMLPHMKSCVAVSTNLQERLRGLGLGSTLITHGIDLEHWRIQRKALPEQAERPIALFWGHADRRLDTRICLALAERMTLRMVGPQTDVDPALLEAKNIDWAGAVDYSELPREAARADVLVMPYADLPVTRAMQPLKLKEYLATGLPVVAAPLPAAQDWSHAMDLIAEPARFAAVAEERARAALPDAQSEARTRLTQESWTQKSHAFEDVLLRHAPEVSA